jgi:hypothetical protein
MFKVKYKEVFVDDIWGLTIDEIYNCNIIGEKYIVYDHIFSGVNSSILTLTYDKIMFNERFITICEERKLKLEKINESNL